MGIEELRIGNLLRCSETKTLLKVISICETGFTTYVINRSKYPLPDGWKAEPIPLTEELLLKFGFELRCKTEDGMIYGIGNTTLIYCHTDYNDFGFFLNGYHNDVYIQLFHQLQNIIHSLTCQELEIKK